MIKICAKLKMACSKIKLASNTTGSERLQCVVLFSLIGDNGQEDIKMSNGKTNVIISQIIEYNQER